MAQIQFDEGRSVEPYFSRVMGHIGEDWTLHEEIVAKWYKFAGLNLLRDSDGKPTSPATIRDVKKLRAADEWMARAQSATPKAGVRATRNKIAARFGVHYMRHNESPTASGGHGEDDTRKRQSCRGTVRPA